MVNDLTPRTAEITEVSAIQRYLAKPIELMQKAGLLAAPKESQLVSLLDEVKDVDEQRVVAIAGAVRHVDTFYDFVNETAQGMRIDDRYRDITDKFGSISEDANMLLAHQADGKVSLFERAQQLYMGASRGSIQTRIEKIGKTYDAVSRDVADQIQRERQFMDAYGDFRIAVKNAEVLARDVQAKQSKIVDSKKLELSSSQSAIESYVAGDAAERARLEVARDVLDSAYNSERLKSELLTKVVINFEAAYQVGDALLQKIRNSHEAKRNIYMQAVTFFGTNKQILATMGFAYTSQQGLEEATRTTEAMRDGIAQGLENLAKLGSSDERAVRVAHESMYKPESIKMLVDATTSWHENIGKVVAEASARREADMIEIRQIVEDGKKRRLAADIASYKASAPKQE